MSTPNRYTLPKLERLNSRILIEKLFTGGSKSLPAFPLRIVYMPVEGEHLPAVSLLISVPKNVSNGRSNVIVSNGKYAKPTVSTRTACTKALKLLARKS